MRRATIALLAKTASKATGVYIIRNAANGALYIGSTCDAGGFSARWRKHRSALERGVHANVHLQRAWNKYSADRFEFRILLVCDSQNCLWYEQLALDHYQPRYNILRRAGNSVGFKLTTAQKEKIRRYRIGRSHSDKTRAKIAASSIGSANACSKLNEQQISEIKQLLRIGLKQKEVASRFSISQTTVSEINTGRKWKHVR